MENLSRIRSCLVVLFVIGLAGPLSAQPAVRFPQSGTAGYQAPQPGGGIAPPAAASPPGTLGAPFDPFASGGAAGTPPSLNTVPPSGFGPLPSTPPGGSPPMMTQPGVAPSYPGSPPGALPAAPYNAPYSQPYYGPGAAPGTTPSALYPNGWNTGNWQLPGTRFLTPRVRYTYVKGGKAIDDLGMNDFDFSAAAAFPNFLLSNQPLYVVPSFSLHLWQGPQSPLFDLPAQAYSGFMDFGWSTDPSRPLGGEVGLRLGVFTDFNTFNTDSGRIMGQGLFRLRATPTTTLRGGVIYLDRNKFKLFPAFGVLWTPNSRTRFDIFFPRPKLAQHLTTMGNQDLWWYVAGEYGGGAWTVERSFGSDRIDINDIRLILGIEWGQAALLQQGRRTGFFEAGWVTDREIVSVVEASTVSLSDTFMLRIGWNY